MINLLAIAGAALVAAVIAVMLRRYHAEYGMLISILAGVLILAMLLEALPQGKYEIADDILRGFERIEIMEESNIAPSSLVREFIGGSIYPS